MTIDDTSPSPEPFASPAAAMAIPRVGSLALSPAGDRLVAGITHLSEDGGSWVSSPWSLDPEGLSSARRLTRSTEGESEAAFLPDGSLLFLSSRPRPTSGEVGPETPERSALWHLPAHGGEPRLVADRPGGMTALATGRASTTVVVAAKSAPGPVDDEEDRSWWENRRTKKVSAVLHERMPARYWDHHLGPDELHLYAAGIDPDTPEGLAHLRDLTPDAGQALDDATPVLSPDGTTVLTEWRVPLNRARFRSDVVAIDVATGDRRSLASAEDGAWNYRSPAVSPDGMQVVMVRESRPTREECWAIELWLVDLDTGKGRALDIGDGPYVQDVSFGADGSSLIVEADREGRAPLYRVDVDTGKVARLTGERAWSAPVPSPDGQALFALRSGWDEPPRPVRLDLTGPLPATEPGTTALAVPGVIDRLPGNLVEISTTVSDGTTVRSWLALPAGASADTPAPLVLWVHGGPVSSWNAWSWRWDPWLLVARGWAVLLPDPALSTGYGREMIRRGWGQWGGTPYQDVMAATDAALERRDLDATRTALMGGSYGGYMANWVAGHTNRFSAIVSHASLWSLEQFQATTDCTEEFADLFGNPETDPEFYRSWSPDRFADAISTPMLVIHGDHDYRCPVGESLRLWTDLMRRGVHARFLRFADENHWILKPGDAVVWYETVLAFLAENVLGDRWERPELA